MCAELLYRILALIVAFNIEALTTACMGLQSLAFFLRSEVGRWPSVKAIGGTVDS